MKTTRRECLSLRPSRSCRPTARGLASRLASVAVLVSLLATPAACSRTSKDAATAEALSSDEQRRADEQAVLQADGALAKAATTKDLEGYLQLWSDDALELVPNIPAVTKTSLRKLLADEMANPGFAVSWHPTKAVASRGGDMAYTMGAYEFTLNNAKGVTVTERGKYVTLWRKHPDGRWKVAVDIYNPDSPPTEGR